MSPIPRIEFDGRAAREIDRFLGRLPKLDKALQDRLPDAAREIGEVITDRARNWAPVLTGNLRSNIRYEIRGKSSLVVGIWGVDYAYMIEYGINSPMIVPAHTRTQTQAFGEDIEPRKVDVSTFVRRTKVAGRDFLHRSYFNSFRAMFGIMNKHIEAAKKEAELARN